MSDSDDVDASIYAAIRDHDKESLGAAIRALDAGEVFYRATVDQTKDGQRVSTPLARLSDGSHALVVYTSKSHPDLPKTFGGASWRHVLNMASALPQADWLIVSTNGGDWLPINKGQIRVIIEGLERIEHRDAAELDVANVAAGTGLERLISEAKEDPQSAWSEQLIESLRDRELFVRISPELSTNGRPVMITSEVGGISGLVQAYTTRNRRGMSYGGMTWEEIVSMVLDASEIPGVHIINDDDDWVVLGRSEI